jgi:hypothetical protein
VVAAAPFLRQHCTQGVEINWPTFGGQPVASIPVSHFPESVYHSECDNGPKIKCPFSLLVVDSE